MSDVSTAARWRAGIMAAVLIAGGGGYWLGQRDSDVPSSAASDEGRKILYYYDPMFPNQKFEKPGKSPFMDMELVPKYADEGGANGAPSGISVDPSAMQNLGMRVVAAETGSLAASFDVTGTIDFNERDVAIVQARSGGFVERVYRLAPGDVIRAGTPIADVQSPEWGGAQTEYLSVKRLGKPELTAAARQRLRLMGMADTVIAQVDRTGRTSGTVTIRSPIGGVVRSLDARAGVTLAQGQTLAEVSGLGSVWLHAALPEAQAASVRVGQRAVATLTAFPGETFGGRVIAILPTIQSDSRTLTVRIELPNRGGRLRPGMFANVTLGGDAEPALLVPSEAVIRTGTRSIVMLATGDGRYHPAEVQTGREGDGKTEILRGLTVGEKIVASGQFLLDSEASLTGIAVRPLGDAK
ncbi:efflux RND transporter periplasmic adaptor subunit [Sphingopyxis alaskensis]|jgi:Cu(I)/Ag(I) efflux system membrane fusion protein|uniref:Secretion protein HlyD n=1 Tax=Sphingopyxis alaskensis (strain DSM 13593 / LMG 18877 / RB2256) TaxID=317655 RepID=Q1GQG9_SPHAL|nr:efflux RND transporter periplasmic adaptor subunit [Sphingopyxis alaskensis]ABF54103.1 Secretion protein HlyD [Sphingopyxis alaskensis RB2256]MCM3418820.1 efflux RND transporter periplasmic adaptor subunit [Sphingopyxis alaskensis]